MRHIVKIAIAGSCSIVVGIAITQPGSAQQQPTNSPSTMTAPSGHSGDGPAMGQQMMQQGMRHERKGQSMQGTGQGMKKNGQAMERAEHGHMGQAGQTNGTSMSLQSNSSTAPKESF